MKSILPWLVRLFPAAFRERFADEVIEHGARDCERARSRGVPAAIWCACATVVDIVGCAIAERWSPSAPDVPVSQSEGGRMRWTLYEWARDLRHAARALRRTPGMTMMAVTTLGLAIGAAAGMFGVVDAVLLKPFPFVNADRLVHIAATAPGSDMQGEFGVSAEFFVQYKEQSRLLEDLAWYNSFTATLRTPDRVERIRMSAPANSLFTTLGVRPVLGRLPKDDEEDRVAVISDALWTSWFGRDPGVVGRSYEMAGAPRTVVGVMASDFRFPGDGTLLWIGGVMRVDRIRTGSFGLPLVGRLAQGATIDALRGELTTLARGLPQRFGGSTNYARMIEKHRAVVRPFDEELLGLVARPLWVLLAAVGIVLLIACANVSNLFTVRAEVRHHDLAVRRAIGAARSHLVRLQMCEAVVVAGLAGALAVALAWITLPVFVRVAPPTMPRLADVRFSGTTLLFTALAAALSAIVCGAIPALRSSAPDLSRLRDGSRGATRRRHWGRDGLVVAQTGLALVLLIGSGLLLRSFWKLSHVNPGYNTKDIFTFQIAPDHPGLTDGPSFARFNLDFLNRLAALPGVESVGLVENVPLNETTAIARFHREGAADEAEGGTLVHFTWAAGDYFKTMGIRLLQGRSFDTNDHLSALPNAVISRTVARGLWPGQNPIGQRLVRGGELYTVIGVVDDVMQNSFRDEPQALVYFPLVGPTPRSWAISSPAYVVKTPRAETIAGDIRGLARKVAPEAPMYRAFTMDALTKDSMVQLSFTMLTLAIASMLALVLGAVGLYGVLSYVVAERRYEIGVRMALGAKAEQVRRMVVVEGVRVVAVGVAIGVAAAVVSTRALGTLLFGVAPLDGATFVAMSISMVAVGLLASYLPARRASKVDPIVSLRGD